MIVTSTTINFVPVATTVAVQSQCTMQEGYNDITGSSMSNHRSSMSCCESFALDFREVASLYHMFNFNQVTTSVDQSCT